MVLRWYVLIFFNVENQRSPSTAVRGHVHIIFDNFILLENVSQRVLFINCLRIGLISKHFAKTIIIKNFQFMNYLNYRHRYDKNVNKDVRPSICIT